MKKLLFLSVIGITLFSACGEHKSETANASTKDTTLQYFGDSITLDGAIAADQLATKMKGKDSLKVKLTGTIEDVCQKKGCWMNLNIGNNQSMKVTFKDYSFFVPKDAANKTVTIEGVAFNDTTSVADLKHYAEDGGKTKEEIAKITAPEINIGFEAHGVIIKK
ncbi:MAG: DUF4920 domain-containing protein [Bacteroidetes bacterium]|nr:DUF4920 domain-containing protein [Bacteroidota bacterium]